MEEQRLALVITGHVDHGKSTLIGRLLYETGALQEGLIKEIQDNLKGTGIKMEFAHIMDYFEEERKQQRTIDTTQFFFKTKKRPYVIIDTPGHKEFIKNMMTGSSQAQAAILILSAKEGIEEQTKRHAYILKMLGIKNIIMAINKMDTAGYSKEKFEQIVESAQGIIAFLGIIPERIVPISAQTGENIARRSKNLAWHKGACLLDILDGVQVAQLSRNVAFRFPVQDVFVVNGVSMLLGNVVSGSVKTSQELVVCPSSKKVRIKTIEVFGRTLKEARAGQSIGMTVSDVGTIKRGCVLCAGKQAPHVENRLKAHVFWLSAQPFSYNDELIIKCATFETRCRFEEISERLDSSTLAVVEQNSRTIEETQVANVMISIAEPMVFEDFNSIEELGRFVLLRNGEVCAGGIVTAQQ